LRCIILVIGALGLIPLSSVAWGSGRCERTVAKLDAASRNPSFHGARSSHENVGYPRFQNDNSNTPLIRAALAGESNKVRSLLLHKANPEELGQNGLTPLIAATVSGNVETIALILARHVNVNQGDDDGITPLMLASNKCDLGTVKLLLEHGASVRLGGKSHCPPLNCLVTLAENRSNSSSELEIANALLNHGADINFEQQYGDTPLIGAINNGDERLVRLLCGRGANVNLSGHLHGETPLMVAVLRNSIPISKILVQHGANVRFTLPDGKSAIRLAKSNGFNKMASFLENAGAK
jgi:ankyrin repeat protein